MFDVQVTGERGFAEIYRRGLEIVYGKGCKPGRTGTLAPWCKGSKPTERPSSLRICNRGRTPRSCSSRVSV